MPDKQSRMMPVGRSCGYWWGYELLLCLEQLMFCFDGAGDATFGKDLPLDRDVAKSD